MIKWIYVLAKKKNTYLNGQKKKVNQGVVEMAGMECR